MALTKEWSRRISLWIDELKRQLYVPGGTIPLEGFITPNRLTPEQAAAGAFVPMPPGTPWGAAWEYGWFRGEVVLPAAVQGQRIVVRLNPGLEGLVFVDGKAAGARDKEHHEITLTRRAQGGERFALLAEFYAGHGPIAESIGPVPPGRVALPPPAPAQRTVEASTWGVWDDEAFGLLIDTEALWQTRNALAETSLRVSEIDEGLRDFTRLVDFEQPADLRAQGYRAARQRLAPLLACVNGSTAPRFHIFGNSHLDLAWQWPQEETVHKSARTVSTQLALLDEYPEYRFFWCQVPLFEALKDHYPEVWARTKAHIDSGRIQVDGGMGIEPDTNIPGGEALIRQVLWAREFYCGELGQHNRVLWLPDTFGFSAVLPQIMKGTGLEFFGTKKIIDNYNDTDRFPLVTFRWRGLDGSEVLSHVFRKSNSVIDPQTLVKRWEVDRLQKDHVATYLFPFGYGDGGGGPTRTHLEFTRRLGNLEGIPRTQWSDPAAFFDDLVSRGPVEELYTGELYFQEHRGTYTSQARTKRANRKAEVALRDAEFWAAAATLEGGLWPAAELTPLWRKLLFNHFHDIISGASIRRVHQEAEAELEAVRAGAEALTDRALSLGPRQAGVTLYNSLSWDRQALVETPSGWTQVEVPAAGWKTLDLEPGSVPTDPVDPVTLTPTADGWTLENRHLSAQIDRQGRLTSVISRASGLEMLAGPANVFRLYQDINNDYDAWDIASFYSSVEVDSGDPATEVVPELVSPWTVRLTVRRTLAHSTLVQQIRLDRNARRIEFHGTVEWKENHRLLKVDFPTRLRADDGLYEIQFGHVRRPTHKNRRYDADRFEGCHHKWMALAETGRGAALLNDGKYGGNILGGTLSLTLLKAAYVPDPQADRGTQVFSYAFLVWDGDFASQGPVREAYDFNVPVRRREGSRPEQSLVRVADPSVILETWKAAEDGTGDLILRFYEASGSGCRTEVGLNFPWSRAWETAMTEEPTGRHTEGPGPLSLEFRAFEIKTLRVRR